MNAGFSGVGQAFAMRNCDAFFTSTGAIRLAAEGKANPSQAPTLYERTEKMVKDVKADAGKYGRDIEVYTQGQVICRPTQREAEEYHHYVNVENADWLAIERMMALRHVTPENTPPEEYAAKRQMQAVSGVGGYPFVGTPDKIAEEFASIARAGARGIAVSFVNFLNEVPYYCDEVLPRLARLGLRQA
jgi:FMNH2-dependent dimethyl sulfone monooxygenase